MYEQIAANKRKTILLIAGFVLLLSLVGAAFVFILGNGSPIGIAVAAL